jgi:hypothetical protein
MRALSLRVVSVRTLEFTGGGMVTSSDTFQGGARRGKFVSNIPTARSHK